MNVEEMKQLISCCSVWGVDTIKVDKIEISFKNNRSVDSVELPEPTRPADEPLPVQDKEVQEEIDKLRKAEELMNMSIEDPARFEELIVSDADLIKDFEDSIEE